MKKFTDIFSEMKKLLLVFSLLAVALAACSKKEESPSDTPVSNKAELTNQFEYKATEGVSVMVTEFSNKYGQNCVTAHANYMYDTSHASVDCVGNMSETVSSHEKNEVVSQVSYNAGNTPVQVTTIWTKN